MNQKTSFRQEVFIVLSIILCMQLYNWVGIPLVYRKVSLFVMPIVIMLVSIKTYFNNSKDVIVRLFKWLIISNVVAMFSAWVFWGQDLSLSWRSMAPYFCVMLFFYFVKVKPRYDLLKKIILILGGVYCIFWLYAMSRFPEVTFGITADDSMSDNLTRGIYRINFTGEIFIIPSFFMALNNIYTEKNNKKLWFLLTVTFYIFIILQVTRQLILWTSVIAIIYIFFKNKKLSIFVGSVFIIIYGLFSSSIIKLSDDTVLGALVNLSEHQMNNSYVNEEDVRITEYRYFFTDYSKNFITDMVGNGMPHDESLYGKRYLELKDSQGLYLSDVGYPSMYVTNGLIGLLIYVSLFIRMSIVGLPNDKMWLRMYMIYMLFANFTASWHSLVEGQLLIAVVGYLIYRNQIKSSKSIVYGESKLETLIDSKEETYHQ